jgi:hypothetical protein
MVTRVVVKNVYNGGRAYFFDALPLNTLIGDLKQQLCDEVDDHPIPAQQRLIYGGKLCDDRQTIGSVLSKHDRDPPHMFHLVLSGRHTTLTRTKSEPLRATKNDETPANAPAVAVAVRASPQSHDPTLPFSTPRRLQKEALRTIAFALPGAAPSSEGGDSNVHGASVFSIVSRTGARAAAGAAAEAPCAKQTRAVTFSPSEETMPLRRELGADYGDWSGAEVISTLARKKMGSLRQQQSERSEFFEEDQEDNLECTITSEGSNDMTSSGDCIDCAEYQRLLGEALNTSTMRGGTEASAAAVNMEATGDAEHIIIGRDDDHAATEHGSLNRMLSPSSSSPLPLPSSSFSPDAAKVDSCAAPLSAHWGEPNIRMRSSSSISPCSPAFAGDVVARMMRSTSHEQQWPTIPATENARRSATWKTYFELVSSLSHLQTQPSTPNPPLACRFSHNDKVAWSLSHFAAAQATLQQQCAVAYLERGYVASVHDASLALASGGLLSTQNLLLDDGSFSSFWLLGHRVQSLYMYADYAEAVARAESILDRRGGTTMALTTAPADTATNYLHDGGNDAETLVVNNNNGNAESTAAPAEAVPPVVAAREQPNRNHDDGRNDEEEALMLGWFRLDYLKLAMKLVMMVLLLGQDGDPVRLAMLTCAAIGYFVYHVVMDRQNNVNAFVNGLAGRGGANNGNNGEAWRGRVRHQGEGAGGQAAAGDNGDDSHGDSDDSGNDDRTQLTPLPLRARGLSEGGIAPGGGPVMDLAYFVLGFLCSLFPFWIPVPAVDPQLAAAHQNHAAHIARITAAQRQRQEQEQQ